MVNKNELTRENSWLVEENGEYFNGLNKLKEYINIFEEEFNKFKTDKDI